MILHRILERNTDSITLELTDDPAEYNFIEGLVESTKPHLDKKGWDYLIATPFRYDIPVEPLYQARFKPPGSMFRIFYAAGNLSTVTFEYSYHWLRERIHLTEISQTAEPRTYFTVEFNDPSLTDIRRHESIGKIMDRNNHTASHNFVLSNPNVSSIMYPSCRDPERGDCVAAFRLETLGKKPLMSTQLNFIYVKDMKAAFVIDPSQILPDSTVSWSQVA